MYSLHDAMARATSETEKMMARMKLSSLSPKERKQKAWVALLDQQPADSKRKRTPEEKEAVRRKKKEIYAKLKEKNGGRSCVVATRGLGKKGKASCGIRKSSIRNTPSWMKKYSKKVPDALALQREQ
eukprot:jgi/Mesvir1/18620/Mv17129-RA.1